MAQDKVTHRLELKRALIVFHRLCGGHNGKSIADAAIRLLDRAGITAQVHIFLIFNIEGLMRICQSGHWTLDNASNNIMFMEELAVLLQAHDIEFDPLDRRIMCFPHVISICCQHVIANFTNIDMAEAAEEFISALPPGLPDRQTFEEAVVRDPMALGRDIVCVLRNSGQRRDLFDDIVRNGNEKGWFLAGTPPKAIQLPQVQLLRDVVTRWDSVYYMVRRLREMRLVG